MYLKHPHRELAGTPTHHFGIEQPAPHHSRPEMGPSHPKHGRGEAAERALAISSGIIEGTYRSPLIIVTNTAASLGAQFNRSFICERDASVRVGASHRPCVYCLPIATWNRSSGEIR